MPTNEPRKHHFIPQFLLKGFANEAGALWTFDGERRAFWSGSPRSTAHQRDLNSVRNADGSMDHSSIESFFDREIESPAAPVIRTILQSERPAHDGWLKFLVFIAAQMVRTPSNLADIERLFEPVMHESLRRMAAFHHEFRENVVARMAEEGAPAEVIKGLLDSVGKGQFKLTPSKELVLKSSLAQLGDLSEILYRMKWSFCRLDDSDEDLLVADHPVILRDVGPEENPPGPLGLTNPNIELMMPLGRRVLARAHWNESQGFGAMLPKQADLINHQTFRYAQRFVYGSCGDHSLLGRFLHRFGKGPRLRTQRIELDGKLAFVSIYQ